MLHQIKEDGIKGVCSMYTKLKIYTNFSLKPERKRQIGRSKYRWEGIPDIKVVLE
jgi:hypothetical protein